MRRKLLLLPVVAAGMVGLTHGQPPGGFGGGGEGGGKRGGMFGGPGGGAPDPEMIWGFVSKGQPTINLNDPANARTKDRMLKDGTPIPADGILTKEAFKASFQAGMDKRAAAGGQPGAAPGQFQQGGPGGMGGGGGRGGPGGGFDPAQMTDEQLSGMMRRTDTDGDGRISAAEATASGRIDPAQFAQYDTNRDGFLDVAEYRVYMTARFQQRQQEQGQPPMPFQPQPGQPSPFPPQPGQPGQPVPGPQQPGSDEPARPEVYRFGKLPKGAPSWMLAPTRDNSAGLDADRDGQIGLYEWRRGGRKIADFVEMDLNGDGYLTYQEWKTYNERLAEKQKAEDPDAPAPTSVVTPAGGGSDRGPKGDRGDRKGQPGGGKGGDKKGGRNPFANGSKGG